MEYEPSLEVVPVVEMMENIKEEFLFPQRISLAMAYVPYQPFNNLYDPETSLKRGTIFKALDMPFMGGKGLRK
ncbi:MAG: hypothetical protein A2Y15_02220 [Clostridiales bacterium GWF2_36_10]|nr:MAG: hypothetical protein A2Y15_02220 [Clostridiales bacterium GWF2_36_10]